jgi:hypothetical protein
MKLHSHQFVEEYGSHKGANAFIQTPKNSKGGSMVYWLNKMGKAYVYASISATVLANDYMWVCYQ